MAQSAAHKHGPTRRTTYQAPNGPNVHIWTS